MFDLIAFIRQLLPANRRTDLNVGFIKLLFSPAASLLLSIDASRKTLLQNARSTGQVIVLESLCNQAVYGSDVGNIYILDGDYGSTDFQVIVPAGLGPVATGLLVGVLNAYKQAGKRYVIVPQASFAANPIAYPVLWEQGYPLLSVDKLVWAIDQSGAFATTVIVDGVTVIRQPINYVAGTPVGLLDSTGAAFAISVGTLSASLTRSLSASHILAFSYQRSGQSLSALVQVDSGDCEVRLQGRNATTYSDNFSDAIVQDTAVSPTTYNRLRGFQSVPDGDYTLQCRIKGQTAITSVDFTLATANQPPVVVNPMPNQTGKVGQYFTYSIPGNVFADPDGYIASYLTTGLPAGVTHSPGHPIAGTPTTAGTYTVRVTVTDNQGATVYDEFTLPILPADSVVDPGSGGTGTGTTPAPTGNTMIVKANSSVMNLVAENNGTAWRVRDTANHSIDSGKQGYWFIDGQPYVGSLSTDYQYLPGDEIIVYYTISTSPDVSAAVWDTKGYAKVVFGTI